MIFILDNLDSFTYNLAQLIASLGREVLVKRASETSVEEILQLQPSHFVFSPGPGHPNEHPFMNQCLQAFAGRIPLLGVCLGMQAMNLFFGGTLRQDEKPMHGKASQIQHQQRGLFAGLPNPLQAARYHSLLVDELGKDLQLEAVTANSEVMAFSHRSLPVHGVQFHPESYLSAGGSQLMENFLRL